MKLGYKLVSTFLLFTVSISLLFYFIELRHQKENFGRIARRHILEDKATFQNLETSDITMLFSVLEVLVQDPGLKNIFLEKDREKLYNYEQPLFQKLKNKYGITHFYFILPDGHVFLRMHEKELYDDLVERISFQKARDTRKPATEIEMGKTAFALRAVMPYFHAGKLIGYLELGEGIDHFLKMLKKETNREFGIIADKEYLDRDDWKSVKQVAGLRDNWDDLEKHVVLSSTSEGKAAAQCFVEENLEQVEKGKNIFRQIQDEDLIFMCGGFELSDTEGKHIGAVLSLQNMTDHIAVAKKANHTILDFAIFLFFVTFTVGIIISRSITKPILKLTEVTKAVERGKLDQRIKISSNDEIGQLGKTFNAMIEMREKTEDALKKSYEEMEARVHKRTEELASLNIALEKEKNQIKLTNTLLELFVRKISRKEYLDEVVKVIQEWSGYHCVGIRIADEYGNIPYESYVGFNQTFMDSENLLSLERDNCACIRVIAEKPELQDLPAMTKYGSFYSNNTLEFLQKLTDSDKTRFRSVCCRLNKFKSMAIIPIRYQEKVLGTIHMTDEKEEMVTLKNVLFIETLAPIIGESIYRFNAEESLRKSQEHLRNLTAHLQEVRENERTIIAREIHDELGQIMTAIKIELSWVKDKYHDHTDLHQKATSMLSLIDATIQTIKKIITELRPGILDHLGISAALEWQAGEFQRITGIPCDIVTIPEEIHLEKDLTTNIFRIFQEILTNVMRHAQATQISAILEKSDGKIMLTVQDNGKGITDDQISKPASFGILGIRERVNHMGGSFKITGVPGEGTEITIIVPIKNYEDEDFYYFR